MKTFKTNKGITLVALIITIIVLLILTVVAISSITDQGLFTKSQEAVNSYEDSRKEEEGKLAGYSSEIDKYLQKDRVYRNAIVDFYFKITKDNKIEMGDSNTVYETAEFEYVSVTPDIITIVNGYGDPIPDSVKDSSRALKFKIGENEWFYLLLSKDEKILYYAGEEFFLDEQIIREWQTYGTDEQQYMLINNNTNKAYYIYGGEVYGPLDIKSETVEEYNNGEYADYQMPSYIRNATRIISGPDYLFGVIASDGNVYAVVFQINNQNVKEALITDFLRNNNIDYSSALKQIQ